MFLLIFFVAHVVAMSSTIYNPFLYAWMNEYFRAEFRNIVPCLFRGCSTRNEAGVGGVSTACPETTACVGGGMGGAVSVAGAACVTVASPPNPDRDVNQTEDCDDDDEDAITIATSTRASTNISNGVGSCGIARDDDSEDNGTEMSLLNHKAEV